jgi:hypothetical protein
MKIKHILITAVYTIAPLLTLLPPVTPLAKAQQLTRGSCLARVVGEVEGSRVNMRSGPGSDFDSPAFVLVGQVVNELIDDESGRRIFRQDNAGSTWQFVEYVPSRTRGWIRSDFLRQISCSSQDNL